jgi:hypothetical protein
MKNPLARWKKHLTEPVFPALAWQLSRTAAAGVRFAKKDNSLAGRAVAPLPPGVLAPSFDRPNILDPEALDRTLRDGRAKLGSDGGDISLLVPETCVRIFVLTFEGLPVSPLEREELFRWRIGKLVPLKPADMRLGYDVVRSNGAAKVVVALGTAEVLGEYEAAFARAGYRVRALSVPTLPLAGLLPAAGARNGDLVVNCEEDSLSLLAVLGGEISLYRTKPFPAGFPDAGDGGGRRDQILREIETTMHFLEDKEKASIDGLWVRAVSWPAGADAVADLRKRWPSLSVSEFPGPGGITPAERRLLAPLLGQVS